MRTRLTSGFQLLPEGVGNSRDLAPEVDSLAEALVAVAAAMPSVHQIGLRLRPFVALAQNRGNHAKPETVDAHIARLAEELRTIVAAAQAALRDVPYPFPHPRGQLTIAEFARPEKPGEHEWEKIYNESNSHLEKLFALHYRLLGRLLTIAGDVEDQTPAANTDGP
jgi:hypothetical protein